MIRITSRSRPRQQLDSVHSTVHAAVCNESDLWMILITWPKAGVEEAPNAGVDVEPKAGVDPKPKPP